MGAETKNKLKRTAGYLQLSITLHIKLGKIGEKKNRSQVKRKFFIT
jgi:hypothetical protein